MSGVWAVVLDGVVFTGGDDISSLPLDDEGEGTLSAPPAGLGVPSIRVEDQVFPQRDGIAQYSDWYDPRVITLEDVTISSDDCPECPSAREKAKLISESWSRRCGETELVIFTDCHGTSDDRSVVGPFGVRGRPRVGDISWLATDRKVGSGTFRFDSVDHRLYILDEEGTPGSGEICEDVPFRADYHEIVTASAGQAWFLHDPPAPGGATAPAAVGDQDGFYFGSNVAGNTISMFPHSNVVAQIRKTPGGYVGLSVDGSYNTIEFIVRFASLDSAVYFGFAGNNFQLGRNYVRWTGSSTPGVFTPLNLNTPYHVVVVRTGTSVEVFVNGLSYATVSQPGGGR